MAALIPHDCNSENPIMKRTLVRHFAAKNYDGISNLLRHLDIQKARAQATLFLENFSPADLMCVTLIGHSKALRTAYCATIVTAGRVGKDVHLVEIPYLFPEDSGNRSIMEAAYNEHGGDLAKYSEEQIAAVDHLGKLAADAIREAEKATGLDDNNETLYFGHAPTLNAVAAALAGTSLERRPDLRTDLGEGDRIVIDHIGKVTFYPLKVLVVE